MARFRFKTKRLSRIFSLASFEMLSNRELSIDGCRGIIEYNDIYVKIKIPNREITIIGSSLDIPVFDGPQITVTGIIKSVEFFDFSNPNQVVV